MRLARAKCSKGTVDALNTLRRASTGRHSRKVPVKKRYSTERRRKSTAMPTSPLETSLQKYTDPFKKTLKEFPTKMVLGDFRHKYYRPALPAPTEWYFLATFLMSMGGERSDRSLGNNKEYNYRPS
jgi:hypothetical protein